MSIMHYDLGSLVRYTDDSKTDRGRVAGIFGKKTKIQQSLPLASTSLYSRHKYARFALEFITPFNISGIIILY